MKIPDSGAVSIHFRLRPCIGFSATITLYAVGTVWRQLSIRRWP